MKLATLAPLVFFAVSLAASSSAQVRRPLPSPTPAPRALEVGWPHDLLTGAPTNCSRDPGPNEVIVYRDESFGGTCAVMQPGFYAGPANLVVGNDAISSIKIGSAVRARVYRDAGYGGPFEVLRSGSLPALGSFNDMISSMRVEPANRDALCLPANLRDGEIALSSGLNGFGDCVVLPGNVSYPDSNHLGLANDSMVTMVNHSGHTLQAYWNNSFTAPALTVAPHTGAVIDAKLQHPNGGSVSSIRMQ